MIFAIFTPKIRFFLNLKKSPRAELEALAGLMRPAGRHLGTPGLKTALFFVLCNVSVNQVFYPYFS